MQSSQLSYYFLTFTALSVTVIGEKICAVSSQYNDEAMAYDPDQGQCNYADLDAGDVGDDYDNTDGLKKPKSPFDDEIYSGVLKCTRIYLTDFGTEFVSDEDFVKIKEFLYYSISKCVDNGVGRTFNILPLMYERNRQICCSLEDCGQMLLHTPKSDFVKAYNSTDLIWNNASFAQSWYNETDYINSTLLDLKTYYGENSCSQNSLVFITNRVMDMDVITQEDQIPNVFTFFKEEIEYYCVRVTIIVVGRSELTTQMLQKHYGNITKHLYSVPDFNCLASELTECLPPCGSKALQDCSRKNLTKCHVPSSIPTVLPTQHTMSDKYIDTWHITYIFALSDNITEEAFLNVKNAVKRPIEEKYYKVNKTISVALLFPETPFNLPWIHDSATLEEQLNIEHLASILHVPGVIDNNSMSTLDMFNKAVDKYRKLYPDFERQPVQEPVPRLILVTDFVSLKFIDNFLARHAKHTLAKFELKIHVLNNNTTLHYYIDHNLISARDIDLRDSSNPSLIIPVDPDDENYAQSNDQNGLASNSSRLYYPGPSKEKLVFFTVLISFSAFILLLVAGTFIYRRKLLWIHKLEHFRAHHRKNPVQCEEQIMADYWELSWDKLLVKSEKLGSGAYGQVFRGSIIGKPPCFDYVYHNRPNCVIDMENCEVAVKMLPRYASDAARDEFLYEIDMMKSMGYNENIVNMLGCITIGRTLCLVLEFCPNKDLLHYVKIVKEEMDESDEIEDKLAYIKDFLLFAWQISDGMRFLNSKGIIHRDLAARNILIDAERNAKICDFGLCITTNYKSLPLSDSSSRSKQPHKVSTSGRLPIKWLAIECLQNQEFSYKSDVWSFAILLYETYSFGAPPFHDIEPQLLLSHLEMGNRPSKPEYCPGEIYDIMQKCWSKAPDDRPTFHELLTLFTILLERATEGYGYLSLLKSNAGPCGKINKLIMAKSFRHESSPERRRSRAALDLTRRAQSNANLKSLENSKRGGNAAMKRQRSSLFGFY